MRKKTFISDILKLSVPERIQLVEDIWDSIAAIPEPLELTPAQQKELDRRLEDLRKNPDLGSPWETVIARIRRSA